MRVDEFLESSLSSLRRNSKMASFRKPVCGIDHLQFMDFTRVGSTASLARESVTRSWAVIKISGESRLNPGLHSDAGNLPLVDGGLETEVKRMEGPHVGQVDQSPTSRK